MFITENKHDNLNDTKTSRSVRIRDNLKEKISSQFYEANSSFNIFDKTKLDDKVKLFDGLKNKNQSS